MRNLLVLVIAACVMASGAWAVPNDKSPSKVIYRYKNSAGTTVLDSKIPPEYVRNGYEIVSVSGKVIKVVPPAPDSEIAMQALQDRLAREARELDDLQLRRSYSNVGDIDAAKIRNLESLRGNISILQANLSSIKSRLLAYQSQAAAIERTGRALPDDLQKNINKLTQDEKDIQLQIQQREQEHTEVAKKFDEDRKRFVEITSQP